MARGGLVNNKKKYLTFLAFCIEINFRQLSCILDVNVNCLSISIKTIRNEKTPLEHGKNEES